MRLRGAPFYRAAVGWALVLALASLFTSVCGRVFGSPSPTGDGRDPSSSGQRPGATQPQGTRLEYVGSKACQRCHAAIFDSYSRTSMAQTSGPAFRGLVPGAFTHQPSSIAYRVTQADDQVYLEYRRTDNVATHGIQQLQYFLGSGKHGRAYLFTLDGYLFQSPINYYSDPAHWDMSPGYQNVREMPMNHAVERSCLFCHTSQVAAPAGGTVNRYPSPPFAEDGVSCERCHGPGSAHVSGNGRMFVPSASDTAARDSICAQCHLEGDATVAAAGKDLFDFKPGNHLSDFISVFLVRTSGGQTLHPASHFEALAASKCKLKSGDRMSCITCHDPHSQPASSAHAVGAAPFPAGEVANSKGATYYRAKCLACHSGARFATQHHPEQPDCTICHMPRLRSSDAAHAMLTDHRIPRKPIPLEAASQPVFTHAATDTAVTPFLGRDDARSLGLAYAQLAETDPSYSEPAIAKLQEALKEGTRDADLLTRLAFLQQESGNLKGAEQLYGEVLSLDPLNRVANSNLGVIYAKSGRLNDAVQLWARIFDLNPFLSEVGTNLAVAECGSGDEPSARDRLKYVLHFNPDYRRAQDLLTAIQNHSHICARN